jgi:hypothetical protein
MLNIGAMVHNEDASCIRLAKLCGVAIMSTQRKFCAKLERGINLVSFIVERNNSTLVFDYAYVFWHMVYLFLGLRPPNNVTYLFNGQYKHTIYLTMQISGYSGI